MHRLLVESAALSLSEPELSPEAARHLKVLRPKSGEAIELFNGRGNYRVYRYDAALKRLVLPEGDNPGGPKFVERPSELTLFACVTKGSRWDWTIEKATELGVTRIVPVVSERTIVRIATNERAAKRERWLRIAEEAARQSDAKWLPEITEPVEFKDSLELVKTTDCYVGALTEPMPEPLAQAVRTAAAKGGELPPAVYVGPEGDFTPEELAALLEVATPTSFGPTILRAETAAIFAVSVLQGVRMK